MFCFIPVRHTPYCFQCGLVSNNLALPLPEKNVLQYKCYWTRLLSLEGTTGGKLYWSLALGDVFFENLKTFCKWKCHNITVC